MRRKRRNAFAGLTTVVTLDLLARIGILIAFASVLKSLKETLEGVRVFLDGMADRL